MISQMRLSTVTSRQSCRLFRQKARGEIKGGEPIVDTLGHNPLPPARWGVVLRPGIFTVVFTGTSIGACAIWQYEGMRREALRTKVMGWNLLHRKKAGEAREEMRKWWASLGEGEKMFWPICGLNILVFAAWKVPVLQPIMIKLFMSNPASKATCLPLLLSTFSHHSFIHLLANMVVLHSFMPPTVHMMGKEQFLAIYLSSGVITSFASMLYKVAIGSTAYSLGASGAICCVLGTFGMYMPEAKMQILFLPMITFTAMTGIKGLAMMDMTGMVMRWKLFDHAAHLSGLLCGVGWAVWGSREVWGRREGLVTAWHNSRNRKD